MFDYHSAEADDYTFVYLLSAHVLEADSRMRARRNTGLLPHLISLMMLYFGDVTLKCALS